MAPYLDTVKVGTRRLFYPAAPVVVSLFLSCSLPSKSFADVPITDAGVDTLAFLEASEGLLGLFGASVLRFLAVNTPNDLI